MIVSLTPLETKDFIVSSSNNLYYWESIGPVFEGKYSSRIGFKLRSDCVADAIGTLTKYAR